MLNQGLELADAVFFELDQNGNLFERKDAKRAYLQDGYWLLTQVERYKGGERLASVDELKVPTNLKPEFVQERLARPETIPLFELPGKIEAANSFGLRANPFAMQLHSLHRPALADGRHDPHCRNSLDAICADGAVRDDDSGWHRRRLSALCRIGIGSVRLAMRD